MSLFIIIIAKISKQTKFKIAILNLNRNLRQITVNNGIHTIDSIPK